MFHFIKKIYTQYKYGASCCKIYSLYYYWSKQLLKEIIAYKKYAGQYIDLTYDDFDKKIDKIIRAFELIVEDNTEYNLDEKIRKSNQKEIEDGLKLFAENFERFWY